LRAALLLGSGFILWVIGWLNDSYAAYLMSSAAMALLVLCWGWARLSAREFSCRVRAPSHTTQGQPVFLQWQVDNRSRFARSLLVTLTAENTTLQEPFPSQRVIELAPAVAARVLTERIAFPVRGRYVLHQGKAYTSDPLGVFYVPRNIEGAGDILVYPAAEPFPRSESHGPGQVRSGEVRATRFASDVGDYYGIRAYQQGDDLRRIHWKATAHTGDLAVKDYEQWSSTCYIVVLELAHFAHRGAGSASSLEAAVRAAATVSSHALALGRSLGLAAIGSQRLVMSPDRGHKQFIRVMEALAVVKADGEAPLAEQMAGGSIPLPGGCTAVLVASSAAPSLVQPACALRARGIKVVVILVAAHSFEDGRGRRWRQRQRDDEAALKAMVAEFEGCAAVSVLQRGQTLASALAGTRPWL